MIVKLHSTRSLASLRCIDSLLEWLVVRTMRWLLIKINGLVVCRRLRSTPLTGQCTAVRLSHINGVFGRLAADNGPMAQPFNLQPYAQYRVAIWSSDQLQCGRVRRGRLSEHYAIVPGKWGTYGPYPSSRVQFWQRACNILYITQRKCCLNLHTVLRIRVKFMTFPATLRVMNFVTHTSQ